MIIGVGEVYATTYYVANSGNDGGAGSILNPFRTLNHGVRQLRPGDTLYVRHGVYAESLDYAIPGGSSWQSPVVIAGYPGERPVIKPNSGHPIVLYCDDNRYIIIDNFVLDGANSSTGTSGLKLASDPTCGSPHHIRFQNSEVRNMSNTGIFVGGTPYPGYLQDAGCCNEFLNLDVHDNAHDYEDQGFYIQSGKNLIDGNRVTHNSCCGIYIFISGYSHPHDNIVRNNLVVENGLAHPEHGGYGILAQGDRDQVYNNIIVGHPGGGVFIYDGAVSSKALNNTIYKNGGACVHLGPGVSNPEIRNNICYQNGGTFYNQGSGLTESHNLSTNPLFFDIGNLDFRLQSVSPAIGAGLNLISVGIVDDILNVLRPVTGAWTIGAVEMLGSGQPAPIPSPVPPPVVVPPTIDVEPILQSVVTPVPPVVVPTPVVNPPVVVEPPIIPVTPEEAILIPEVVAQIPEVEIDPDLEPAPVSTGGVSMAAPIAVLALVAVLVSWKQSLKLMLILGFMLYRIWQLRVKKECDVVCFIEDQRQHILEYDSVTKTYILKER
jgi:parallel beta-helix repeat protein